MFWIDDAVRDNVQREIELIQASVIIQPISVCLPIKPFFGIYNE